MVGKVLAERYELIEKIAEGGMARVYRGRDLLLKRTIAIKILKDQMTGDAAFIRRFEREAQSAAALSHPHIVNIYDVGEQEGTYFMIMEHVDGSNLKQHIREKGRLPVHEAVRISRQIAEALEEAHKAGVVHRDIKPQNILFSREGKVKVTDFGIAIAGDGATVTVGDEIIGTVQYIAPEQARGEIAGKQSDLYSLGIVFYEMVTGKVPFTGESPVAVAMKHIQEQIVPPGRLVSDLPEQVEQVIMKAVEKDAANRYNTADEFLEDLFHAENKREPKGAPKRNYVNNIDYEDEEDLVLRPTPSRPSKKQGKRVSPRLVKALAGVVLLLALAAALVGGGWHVVNNMLVPPEVAVPEVRNLTQSEAIEALREANLTPSTQVTYIYDDQIDVGHVVKTDPPEGRIVRHEREISLFISQGPEFIATPDLFGRTENEARVILNDLDLAMSVVSDYNEDVEKGQIYRQVPGESFRIAPGEEVVVYVSEGRGPFELADLVGRSEEGALNYLRTNDLNARVRTRFSVGNSGFVIEQDPEPGTEVLPDQIIELVVGE